MASMPKPCSCQVDCIGLSDGSSVHGWRCTKCGHEWPRQITVRGIAKFNYVKSGGDAEQAQQLMRDAKQRQQTIDGIMRRITDD